MRFSKKLLLQFIPGLILIPCLSIAQDTLTTSKKFRFEAGVNPGACFRFSIRSIEKISFADPYPSAFFKYTKKRFAFRSSIDPDYATYHILRNIPHSYYKDDGTAFGFTSALGYEQRFSLKRFVVFIFVDGSIKKSHAKGVFTSVGCIQQVYDQPYYKIYTAYSILSGAGLNYRIASRINLVYEFATWREYSYYKDILKNPIQTWKSGWSGLCFNPIRTLGVSYTF